MSSMRMARGPRAGFTVVELLAVLVVLALLAATATAAFRDPLRQARLASDCQCLALADRQARDHVRRFSRPVELTFDLDQKTLSRSEPGGRGETAGSKSILHCDRLVLPNRPLASGRGTVRISRKGQSSTYAVRLDQGGAARRWVVFLGVTGEAIETDDEELVRQVFQFLEAAGAHAH